MAFFFRPATTNDIGTLIRLNKAVQSLHAAIEPGFFKAVTRAEELEIYFGNVLDNPDNEIILAEEDGAALGYVWFQIQRLAETPFTWPRQRTYIYQIAVDEAFRRRGLGTALLSHVERLSQEAGSNGLALDAWTGNAGAQAFFIARGFSSPSQGYEKPIGRRPDET